MLVLDFNVNSRLKNAQRNFQWNPWNALNKDAKKKRYFAIQRGTHAIFATSIKLLDIKSEVYGSGGDVIETNN